MVWGLVLAFATLGLAFAQTTVTKLLGLERWGGVDTTPLPADMVKPKDPVLLEYLSDGRIAILTLNRPQAKNRLKRAMAAAAHRSKSIVARCATSGGPSWPLSTVWVSGKVAMRYVFVMALVVAFVVLSLVAHRSARAQRINYRCRDRVAPRRIHCHSHRTDQARALRNPLATPPCMRATSTRLNLEIARPSGTGMWANAMLWTTKCGC